LKIVGIGVASYGARAGDVPLLNFQPFLLFWSLQSRTNSDIQLHWSPIQ